MTEYIPRPFVLDEDWSEVRRKFYRLAKKNYDRRPECCGPAFRERSLGYFYYHGNKRYKDVNEMTGWYLDEMAKPVSEKVNFCPFCGARMVDQIYADSGEKYVPL